MIGSGRARTQRALHAGAVVITRYLVSVNMKEQEGDIQGAFSISVSPTRRYPAPVAPRSSSAARSFKVDFQPLSRGSEDLRFDRV